MNRTDRALGVLLGLALAAAGVLGAGALLGAWRAASVLPAFDPAALDSLHGSAAVTALIVLAAATVVGALLIVLSLRRRRLPHFVVEITDAGETRVERQTVRQFVEHVAGRQSGVRGVYAAIHDVGGGGIDVLCRVTADPSVVVAEVGANIRESVTEAVSRQLGLTVHNVDARVRMEASRARRANVK